MLNQPLQSSRISIKLKKVSNQFACTFLRASKVQKYKIFYSEKLESVAKELINHTIKKSFDKGTAR